MDTSLFKQKLDFNNATIVTSTALVAAYFAGFSNTEHGLWIILSALFLSLSRFGQTFLRKAMYLVLTAFVFAIAVGITTALQGSMGIFPWLFILSFLVYLAPRYLPGSDLAAVFALSFAAFAQGMPITGEGVVGGRMADILQGGMIALAGLVFFYPIPCHHKVIHYKNRSTYLIKRAFRVSIAILLASLLCFYFDIYNSAWVLISAIVIIQNNLGGTIKRAGQRLLGTFLGVLCGILFSYFLFEPYPQTTILAFAFIFLLVMSIRNYYLLAIFFGTVLLTSLFYYFDFGTETISHFMLSRLNDTLLGIIIGLLSEILIFPNTIFKSIRKDIQEFWVMGGAYLLSNDPKDAEKIVEKVKLLQEDIYNFRFEPVTLLLGRYKLLSETTHLMPIFFNHLKSFQLIREKEGASEILDKVSGEMANIMDTLATRYYQLKLHDIQFLQESRARLKEFDDFPNKISQVESLIKVMDKILEQYEKMVETPRWRYGWGMSS